MAGGRFAKQASFKGYALWNSNNANDTLIGGGLSVAPSNSNLGSQFWQNYPGDRVILSPVDAFALQNNAVGNLYTGTYRYVATANASSSPARGHGAFWVPVALNNNQEAQDLLYQVTSDELANYGVSLFAGVYLNACGKNSYWWIQEAGKATCSFRNAISGTPTIGQGVYLTAGGNNNNAVDVGSFDQLFAFNAGTTFSAANTTTAYNAIDNMFVRNVGVAESLPANNNVSIVDIGFSRSYRW